MVAGEARIRLSTSSNGWCQVSLDVGPRTFELGADTYKIIVARMAAGLSQDSLGPSSGILDGNEVRAVLSLQEAHGTIYTSTAASAGQALLFQDADGKLIAKVLLSAAERADWLEKLLAAQRHPAQ